jgi:hypothetical protein
LLKQWPAIFTRDVLVSIDQANKHSVRMLFELATATAETTKWPVHMKDKDVLLHSLRRRVEQVGDRFQGPWKECLQPSGAIHWKSAGAFSLKLGEPAENSDQVPVVIRHIGGLETDLPRSVSTSKLAMQEWELVGLLHDRTATLKLGTFEIKLCSRFATELGPNADCIINEKGKVFSELGNAVVAALKTGVLAREWAGHQNMELARAAIEMETNNEDGRKAALAQKRKLIKKPDAPNQKKIKVSVL